jgi:hypothetical protein
MCCAVGFGEKGLYSGGYCQVGKAEHGGVVDNELQVLISY